MKNLGIILASLLFVIIPTKSWAPVFDDFKPQAPIECDGRIQEVVCRTLQYKPHIVAALQQENVKINTPEIAEVLATIAHESGGKQTARGHSGEIGLMQLMPTTAKRMGVNPYVADDNILGGVRYRKLLRDTFGFDGRLLLGAYNAGEGNALKGRIKHSYIRSVQSWTKIFIDILEKEHSYG